MKVTKVEKWEKNHINNLTLRMILLATFGTVAAAALAFLLQKIGLPEIRPELLFMPWGIALVFGVSYGFHQGVLAERTRANGSASN